MMRNDMSAVILITVGLSTGALFVADKILESRWQTRVSPLPTRRRRSDTLARLFPHDGEFRRRVELVAE